MPEDLQALRLFDGKAHRALPDERLIAFYEERRRRFGVARTHWARAIKERDRTVAGRLRALALKAFRDERADVTALEMRRDEDTSDVVLSLQGRPIRETASASLTGELAIALFEELAEAKTAGFCKLKSCGRPWLSRINKTRQICGRRECILEWRNAHRKAEDPASVYRRVKRYRAAVRAKKGGRGGKKSTR